MTRIRLMGRGVLCALAASLALASGASAAEYNLKMRPEIGRCVFVGKGHNGEYHGGTCVRPEKGGNWVWRSGPGAKPKFTGTVKAVELMLRGAGANELVKCPNGELSGEYTGPKNLRVTTLLLHGCLSNGEQCQNEIGSTNGEVAGKELVGELGFISHPRRLKVGWDLKPASGSNLLSFECGGANSMTGKSLGTGAPREVQGSVIGKIEPLNKKSSELGVIQELDPAGNQFPEKFESGVKDTLTTILGEKAPGTNKTPYPSVIVTAENLKGEEPLEVLGKCVGATC
jgi:hypothetical protein